nr:DUF3106 domain-containing protein [uncultured Rhodoferax sp.]
MKLHFLRILTVFRLSFTGLVFTGLFSLQAHAQTKAHAQTINPTAMPVSSASQSVLPSKLTDLEWTILTSAQQQALQPLAVVWPNLSAPQKKKWIALSVNYRHLSDPEKERLHARMVQWAALTPRQRTQARLNFTKTQQLPVEDKVERWEVYQTLTAEQKKTLAASAPKLPLAPYVKKPVKPTKPQTASSAARAQ